jgi:hypothetical protein
MMNNYHESDKINVQGRWLIMAVATHEAIALKVHLGHGHLPVLAMAQLSPILSKSVVQYHDTGSPSVQR